MLQAARNQFIIPEPSEDLITNDPWSIEFYADGMMDELFADIDEILDVGLNHRYQTLRPGHGVPRSIEQTSTPDLQTNSAQSTTPVASEYEQVQTINVPQVVLSNSLTQTKKTVVVDKPKAIIKRQKTKLNLRKLLITGTTIGVAMASSIYIVQSGLLTVLTDKLTEPDIYVSPAQTQLPNQVDPQAELVDYMLGALAIIEQQRASSNSTSAPPAINNQVVTQLPATTGSLPTPLAANNTPPVNKTTTNVVERVYIPVYQAPSPMRYAPPPVPVRGTNKPLEAGNSQTSKPVQPPAKPATVPTAPKKEKQPSVAVTPARPTLPPTDTQQQAYLPSPVPNTPSYTLEGLLELGEKSAALFEFEGVTRRIHMGESIGNTGWILVDVANGEAIIRRNGEVRSIFAGQKL
jgi:hypothetical protein